MADFLECGDFFAVGCSCGSGRTGGYADADCDDCVAFSATVLCGGGKMGRARADDVKLLATLTNFRGRIGRSKGDGDGDGDTKSWTSIGAGGEM